MEVAREDRMTSRPDHEEEERKQDERLEGGVIEDSQSKKSSITTTLHHHHRPARPLSLSFPPRRTIIYPTRPQSIALVESIETNHRLSSNLNPKGEDNYPPAPELEPERQLQLQPPPQPLPTPEPEPQPHPHPHLQPEPEPEPEPERKSEACKLDHYHHPIDSYAAPLLSKVEDPNWIQVGPTTIRQPHQYHHPPGQEPYHVHQYHHLPSSSTLPPLPPTTSPHPLQSNPYQAIHSNHPYHRPDLDPIDQSNPPLPSHPIPSSSSSRLIPSHSSSPSSPHSAPQDSLDTLLPSSTLSPTPSPYHQLPVPPSTSSLPLHPSPSPSVLSSPSDNDPSNMSSYQPPHPSKRPRDPDPGFSSFDLYSHYSPPDPPSPRHQVPYLISQSNHSAFDSVDELKTPFCDQHKHSLASTAFSSKRSNYPDQSFKLDSHPPYLLQENHHRHHKSNQKNLTNEKLPPPGSATGRALSRIGPRRLALATLAGLLLISAAVSIIIFVHLKRTHTPDVTGDSDGDIVSQSGLGSARNASSSSLGGFDPFNISNTDFGPDNGLRGGANGYDSLIVFGASYCDDAHARPPNFRQSLKPPPYYKGRWTNGYVWNEYLSAVIGPGGRHTTLVNYAFGGATVSNSLNSAPVPDLEQQISAFVSDLSALSAGAGPADGKSLIAVWVGINSVTKIWNSVLKQEVQARTPIDVQNAIFKSQAQINSTVDQIFNFVTNLVHTTAFKAAPPDLLLLPIPPAQLLLVNFRAVKGNLSALRSLAGLSDLFNTRFAEKLGSFQDTLSPEQRVFTLDIPTIWRKLIEDPVSFKLTVVDQPCLTKSGVCNSPGSYLFWDTLHPTTIIHERLALMMSDEIKR